MAKNEVNLATDLFTRMIIDQRVADYEIETRACSGQSHGQRATSGSAKEHGT